MPALQGGDQNLTLSTLRYQSPRHEGLPYGHPTLGGWETEEPQMIEFVRTTQGLFFRFQVTPEALISILILARLWQRLM